MTEENQPLADEATPADAPLPETVEDELAALEDALYEGREPEVEAKAEPEPEAEPVEAKTKEPEATPTPDATDTPVEPQPTPEGMMPYGAYAAEREKRKAQDTELEELRRFKQEREAREAVEAHLHKPDPLPDPLADPDAFGKRYTDDLSAVRQEVFLMRAEMAAEREFGAETVQAAQRAVQAVAQSRPDIQARLINAANPHAEAVAIHREMEILSDPDAYRARIIAEHEAGKTASPTPQAAPRAVLAAQPPQPALPPDIGGVTSVLPASAEPSFEDIESGAFGWG